MTSGLIIFFCLLPGCTEPGQAATRTQQRTVESSAGTVALGLADVSYRVAPAEQPGSIAGAVTLKGQLAADSMVAVQQRDTQLCGDSVSVTNTTGNGGVSNVLIWVDGIVAGKPMPEGRRETLTIQNCLFEPRLMAVLAGTTINLLSQDRAVLTSRFYRENAKEPVEEIRTVDAGQVVPSERIANKPGIVEVRRTQHPWARAYIAVFDHPYFAVTDAEGRFTIDGLPPGTYTAKVWHERLPAPVEQRIVVIPGGAGRLDLTLAMGK